jgi:hypothetical protein
VHSAIYVLITCSVILFGGIYLSLQSEDRQRFSQELSGLQETREKLDQTLTQRQAAIAELESENRVLQVHYRQFEVKAAELAKANAELAELKNKQNTLLESLSNVQQAHREKAIGQNYGTLLLKNGQKLTNVVFKEIKHDLVSIAHSEGFLKVSADNLPDELVEKLGLDAAESISPAEEAAELAYKAALFMAGEKLKNAGKQVVKEKSIEALKTDQVRLEALHQNAMNRYLKSKAVAWRAWSAYAQCKSQKDRPPYEAMAREADARAAQYANEVALKAAKARANHDLIYVREHGSN